jgi:aspartate aminotransferase
MQLSNRAQKVPSSPIRKLVPFADEAKKKGVKVYHLNIGQPDIKTPSVGLEAARNYRADVLAYSHSQGIAPLRKKMAEYYDRFGIRLDPDEIIVTTGGSEALQFAFQAVLDPGDELILTDPSYANYLSFATACGAVVKAVHTSIDEGFRLPPVERFEELITPKTRAILVCNPNNPTGYLYTPEEMLRIRDIVLRHGLFLISDEVYREFIYNGKPYLSAMNLEELEEHLIMVDSVSKRYSECGVRIGTLVTRNKEIRAAVMKFAQARLSPPIYGQVVAAASVDTPASYMAEVWEEYKSRRDFMIEGLNRIPGVFSPKPEGAFYTMVRLPVEDAEEFCKWCLTDFSYEGATVMMAPGAGFYSRPGVGKDEVRMAYVLNKQDLAKALVVLEKALEQYKTVKK